jgi:predicted nucleic acid-binding protein
VARYLLDTNILNSIMKPGTAAPLTAWLDAQADEDIYICSMNLAEIWNGILQLAAGEKHTEQEGWLAGERGRRIVFSGRVLSFDEEAGAIWARLMSERGQACLSCTPVDMIYAAIAEANGCILVTDNEEHFTGLNVLNPMKP